MASSNYTKEFESSRRLCRPATPTQTFETEIGKTISNIYGQVKVAGTLDNGWEHHIIQHTCSEAGAGEQVLLINRFLRTASVTKEISFTKEYFYLDGLLRNKGTPKSALNNIKGKNIQKKVEKELERLDKNIADMEIELDQVAKQSGEERTGLIEIKHMLADLEKRLVSSAVDNKDKNKETILEREQCINTVKELENTEESNQEANLTEEPEQDNKHERDAIMSDDDYLIWLVAENTTDEEEEMDEEIVATAETEISIPKERIETSTPENEKRNKRRRMDSDCDSITNISTFEQDLRDLRYGLHYLPQRKIGETSSGVAPHINCTFCNEYGRHYSDSCPELMNGDERWHYVRDRNLCQYCLMDCDPNRR